MNRTQVARAMLASALALGAGYYGPPSPQEHPHQMWRRGLLASRYGLHATRRGRR